MNHTINDSFMNPDRFGYSVVPFKLDGDREPPKHIAKWRIARTNARSMGKECMNTLNLVSADLSCAGFTITNVLIVGRRMGSEVLF